MSKDINEIFNPGELEFVAQLHTDNCGIQFKRAWHYRYIKSPVVQMNFTYKCSDIKTFDKLEAFDRKSHDIVGKLLAEVRRLKIKCGEPVCAELDEYRDEEEQQADETGG